MANQVARPYPTWIHMRLEALFNNSPRFENSFYGPINAVLHCILPPAQFFMIKPQAILLPNHPAVSSTYLPPGASQHPDASRSSSRIAKVSVKAVQDDGSSGWTSHEKKASVSSVDSFGDLVLPRRKGGWMDGILIPDFIAVKATGEMSEDIILVIAEIKLKNSDLTSSINQVESYLDRLQTKNYSDKFVAYLCMGPTSYVWTTSVKGNICVQSMLSGTVRTGGMEFCNYMLPVRKQHW